MVDNFCAFFDDEGNGPAEEVHEVGQEVGMRAVDELLDVQGVALGRGMSTSNLMTAPLLL
jgi:hypothetical protein